MRMKVTELMKECWGIVLAKSGFKRQGTVMKGKWKRRWAVSARE